MSPQQQQAEATRQVKAPKLKPGMTIPGRGQIMHVRDSRGATSGARTGQKGSCWSGYPCRTRVIVVTFEGARAQGHYWPGDVVEVAA